MSAASSVPRADKNLTAHESSSVVGMTVPSVRQTLALVRQQWSQHACIAPMHLCMRLPCGMTVEEFAFQFVMGHHKKRHRESAGGAAAAGTGSGAAGKKRCA